MPIETASLLRLLHLSSVSVCRHLCFCLLCAAVTAELPWMFLGMIATCATPEFHELLERGGSSNGEAAHLPGLLHKALEHVAGMLHQTAASDKYVSGAPLSSFLWRARLQNVALNSEQCCQDAAFL
jgi:hypothetical protein